MTPRTLSGNRFYTAITSYLNQIDWKMFLFLLLFLNVKVFIKIAAIILIYIIRPNFKFGFKLRSSRLPLFYLAVLLLATFNWLLKGNPGNINYTFIYIVGAGYWLLSILAIHQVRLFVDTSEKEKVHRTLTAFFTANIIISLGQYCLFALQAGVFNLYQYQGDFQKYFISTGDLIRGLTFDVSTTNALISSIGVIYFLSRQQMTLTIGCMIVVLMTGSNLTNIALVIVLIFQFFFRTNKIQKSLVTLCLFLLIIFIGKISPENNDYTKSIFANIFYDQPEAIAPAPTPQNTTVSQTSSEPTLEEKRYLIAKTYIDSMRQVYKTLLEQENKPNEVAPNLAILKIDNYAATSQRKLDTTPIQKILLQAANDPLNLPFSLMANDNREWKSKPGKLIAFNQTVTLLKENYGAAVTGIGMGCFSSRLAFRATGLNITGGYPARFKYINPYFQANHLSLYLYYFSKDAALHSVLNSPNAVYDQLLSEYGLLGLLSFVLLYLGFFVKHTRKLTYGIPLLLLLCASFFWEYWYEQLNVVVLIELLLLLNIKERIIVPEKKEYE